MDNPDATLIVENLFDTDTLLRERQWRELRPGVAISELYNDPRTGASAAFLHYQPGAEVEEHQHSGYEHIIVLAGAQSDGNHHYPRQCLAIQPPGARHRVASAAGCLVLAIWERPVRFV